MFDACVTASYFYSLNTETVLGTLKKIQIMNYTVSRLLGLIMNIITISHTSFYYGHLVSHSLTTVTSQPAAPADLSSLELQTINR